jgi:hypothetical protein
MRPRRLGGRLLTRAQRPGQTVQRAGPRAWRVPGLAESEPWKALGAINPHRGKERPVMRKIQISVTLIAVLTLCALAVAGASATLWLSKGVSLTAETSGTSHGTLTYFHKEGTGVLQITCSGLFEGTYGPGALDLVRLATSLSGSEIELNKCTQDSGFCTSPVLHTANLPWHTLAVSGEARTEDEYLTSAYITSCLGFVNIECSRNNAKATFVKNGPNGAEFEYTQAGTETT